MTVLVSNSLKPESVSTGEKQVSTKKNSDRGAGKGFFESVLSSMKGPSETSGKTGNTAPKLNHRPPTSMITNPEFHRDHAKAVDSNSASAREINAMAVSALISASALTSGQNRLNGFYGAGAGMAATRGLTPSSPSFSGSSHAGGIGGLSAKFESGESGPDVIGYDDKGGTSYGTFQISSRAGTMRQFIDYLEEKAPDWARRLEAAGTANTGCHKGKMPEAWKKIAAENPEKFAKAQYDFIEQSHYLPALQEIAQNTGVDIGQAPKALREVLWSTSVQHGAKGAAKIFTRAIERSKAKNGSIQAANLINSVYSMRAGQFGSSTSNIRAAVRNRFKEEGQIALAMLSEPTFASDSSRA